MLYSVWRSLFTIVYKCDVWRHGPQWICNYYIVRIYHSSGIFTASFL